MVRIIIRKILCGRLRKPNVIFIIFIWFVYVLSLAFRTHIRWTSPEINLVHFRRSRSLMHFLSNIKVLIEPSSLPCLNGKEVPVLALVSNSIARKEHRFTIRNTWGRHFPTYFVVGIGANMSHKQLADLKSEASHYKDIVVFSLIDHYQNLTIKTALMMKWTLNRCPQAGFLYKVDDDVFVNPWLLKKIVRNQSNAKLVGYVHNNCQVYRRDYSKWYMPRWLFPEEIIPQSIAGNGYLINGKYLRDILNAACKVPLHNIEDVFFTYNVARNVLGYELSHDERMSPRKFKINPWFRPLLTLSEELNSCIYWSYASLHSMEPKEILRYWSGLERINKRVIQGETVCNFYKKYLSGFVSEDK